VQLGMHNGSGILMMKVLYLRGQFAVRPSGSRMREWANECR